MPLPWLQALAAPTASRSVTVTRSGRPAVTGLPPPAKRPSEETAAGRPQVAETLRAYQPTPTDTRRTTRYELGDEEAAELELEAARGTFEQLGAAPDLARIDSLSARATGAHTQGLTERELEVLRLVAAGESNRQIAEAPVISEHTVARHLQNMFAKLGVASRTAAAAFALSTASSEGRSSRPVAGPTAHGQE